MPSAKSSIKGKVGGKVKGEETKSTSRSTKAGLQFPVSRIHRMLRRANVSKRIGSGAPGKLPSSLVFFGRVELNSLVLQYTLLPCWSTCRPRSSSWLETQLVTTRSAVSTLVTFNSPSETMKSELLLLFICRNLGLHQSSRLSKLLGDVIISEGGVVPYINPAVRWILLSALFSF
jgi:histone H2A